MGFIEKMVGIMGGTLSQEPSASPPQDAPQADAPAADTPPQPKMYSAQEVESLVAAREKEWKDRQEAEYKERLSRLPEDERLKQEAISKDAQIAQLQAEISKRDLQSEIIAKLGERQLPASLAEMVQYGDKESTMKSAERIMDIFDRAVQETIKLRLRGKTPEGIGAAAATLGEIQDPFAQTFVKAFEK